MAPAGLVALASRVLEGGEDTVVGRVDAEILEPEKGLALTGEDVGDPAEGVVEVPESDADAGLGLGAAADSLGNEVSEMFWRKE